MNARTTREVLFELAMPGLHQIASAKGLLRKMMQCGDILMNNSNMKIQKICPCVNKNNELKYTDMINLVLWLHILSGPC